MSELDPLVGAQTQPLNYIHSYVQPILAEFLGTCLFVFVGVLSAQTLTFTAVALAHGLTIALLIFGLGKISGGHFNPAVTLGVALSGGVSWVLTLWYFIAQILGGMLGAAFTRAILKPDMYKEIGGGTQDISIDPGWAIMAEGILTFILVFTVLMNAVNNYTQNEFAPLAIGFAVAVDIMAAGGTTGASMNPARSFGPAVVATAVIPTNPWKHHYVYWVGPLLGSLAAAIFARIFARNQTSTYGR